MRRSPIIFALQMILAAALTYFYFFAPHTYFWDVNISVTILITMLMTILDSTNLASRRIAWAIGLVVLFTAGPFLIGVEGGAAIFFTRRSSLAFAQHIRLPTSAPDFRRDIHLPVHPSRGSGGAPWLSRSASFRRNLRRPKARATLCLPPLRI
jgi:hypothetical protein